MFWVLVYYSFPLDTINVTITGAVAELIDPKNMNNIGTIQKPDKKNG
jgi:hypothetical protein